MAVIRPTVLNIYKPYKWTSRQLLNHLQKLYNYKKFGHAGTLDPLATGVLIVLVGDKTKTMEYYMNLKKTYRTRIFLGVSSETDDLEGPFTYTKLQESITRESLGDFLDEYKGITSQQVPNYSAVKVNGKELYKHARKGSEIVEAPTKEVELLDYTVLDYNFDTHNISIEKLNEIYDYESRLNYLNSTGSYVDIELRTGKGFYVRSFARDLGARFGGGAFVGTLERTQVGDFSSTESHSIEYFDSKPNLV